jgi:methionyl aminopeptidase
MSIIIKTKDQIEQIKHNGKILRDAVNKAAALTKPGMTTADLDKIIEDHIIANGATPTFKGYGGNKHRKPFPATICISVNDVLVHGIPGPLKIKDGDIVSIDIGVTKNGCVADSCFSYGVGNVKPEHQKLLKAAHDITMYGISIVKPGLRVHDLATQIAEYAESLGPYTVMPDLYGHGTGISLHEPPKIPFTRPIHFKEKIPNPKLEAGFVITIEPVVALSSCKHQYTEDSDGWTLRTLDRSWSAQFEHVVLVTDTGSEILTGEFLQSIPDYPPEYDTIFKASIEDILA